MVSKTLQLNSGYEIPLVGFGTYTAKGDEGYHAVVHALKSGYRLIDTAYIYGNEEEVGRAIKASGVPREEIFVTTKVWPHEYRDPAKALDRSLELLGLEYVDLLLMHWPFPVKPDPTAKNFAGGIDEDWDYFKTWDLFQKLPKSKVRSIGVSNFTLKHLKKLLDDENTKIVPAVNQLELHPWVPDTELVKFCQSQGIVVEAYSPVARGKGQGDSVIEAIAKKHGADSGQVVLSWNVQRNVVVLPKSSTPSRIDSNFKVIELDSEDLARMEELGKNPQRIVNSNSLYGYDIFSE